MRKAWLLAVSSMVFVHFPLMADDSLVRFEGGIGVIPVSNVAGPQNADGTFPNVSRNVVRGVNPGGQPWVISSLSVEIKTDGRIEVDGRGLLLAGGNNICGNPANAVAFNSGLVAVDPNGNFEIDGVLTPTPPATCDSPVLLIVSAGGSWFAAGIQKLH